MIVFVIALGGSTYDVAPNIIGNSIFVLGMVCSATTS
jgi:hypothetical protein